MSSMYVHMLHVHYSPYSHMHSSSGHVTVFHGEFLLFLYKSSRENDVYAEVFFLMKSLTSDDLYKTHTHTHNSYTVLILICLFCFLLQLAGNVSLMFLGQKNMLFHCICYVILFIDIYVIYLFRWLYFILFYYFYFTLFNYFILKFYLILFLSFASAFIFLHCHYSVLADWGEEMIRRDKKLRWNLNLKCFWATNYAFHHYFKCYFFY